MTRLSCIPATDRMHAGIAWKHAGLTAHIMPAHFADEKPPVPADAGKPTMQREYTAGYGCPTYVRATNPGIYSGRSEGNPGHASAFGMPKAGHLFHCNSDIDGSTP